MEKEKEEIKEEEKSLEEEKKEDSTEVLESPESEQTKKPKKSKAGIIIATICTVVFIVIVIVVATAASAFGKILGKIDSTKTADVEKTTPASSYRMTGNGLENFDLYFLQLENKKDNIIYSPLSIKYALAMLNEGTNGETRGQILNVIGDYKSKKYNNNEHMSFANAMFIRNTFKNNVQEDYILRLQNNYGAEVILDPFENASNVNSWVSNKTFNLIDNLLDDSTVQRETFILINALAIDMNWNNQLQCKQGRTIPCENYYVSYLHENYNDHVPEIYNDFSTIQFEGKDVKVAQIGASINRYDIISTLGEDKIRDEVGKELQEYMDNGGEMCDQTFDEVMDQYMSELGANYKQVAESTDFYFYTDDNVKVFAKDLKTYDETTLQYVAVMPKNEELDTYIKDVDAAKLTKLINGLKPIALDSFKDGVITKIHGNIPFFKYEYQLDLMGDLEKLGITNVFDINKADLSKMITGEDKQFIGDATHKAMIEFSNDGIKAAAATAIGGMGASSCRVDFDHVYEVPVEEIDLDFDKPYLYIIRDKATGEVWFTGATYNPE